MFIVLASALIMLITLFAWGMQRILHVKICPICAGVSGTWILLLIAQGFGFRVDMTIPALLMGGTIVGIAYQLEKWLPERRSLLLWKTLFIPLGFIAAYGMLSSLWIVAGTAAFGISMLFLTFKMPRKDKSSSRSQRELEEKMKQCC